MGDELIWFLISAAPTIKAVTLVAWLVAISAVCWLWYMNWVEVFRGITSWRRVFRVAGATRRWFWESVATDALWALVLWPAILVAVIAWGLWVGLV